MPQGKDEMETKQGVPPRSPVRGRAGRGGTEGDSAAPALGHQLVAGSESSSLLCSPFPSFHFCSCRAVQPSPFPGCCQTLL